MATSDLDAHAHRLPGAATAHIADILERISDGLVALDREWRYTYVNSQAARLFGRLPADLIGRHIWTEFPEGVGQPFHHAYERAMAEQVFIHLESYYEPWNRWFENRIYPSPEGLSIFFHEITERKLAEQRAYDSAQLLKGQNDVLELIARDAPVTDTLDLLLRVIEAHCGQEGMLGSILLLDSDGTRVRHGAAPSLPAAYIRVIDGQRIGPDAGSCGTAAYRGEQVIVEDIATDPLWDTYRDAALAHGLRACWSTPILDAEGQVLGTFALYFRTPGRPTARHHELIEICSHTAAIALVRDREIQALRASEARLRLAVTAGNIGTWEWSIRDDRVVSMYPWRKELVPPRTLEAVLETVHPEDRPQVESALDRSVHQHTRFETEYRTIEADGSVNWISAMGRPEYDAAGAPVRMLGVVLDITERKRAVEILEDRVATRTVELRSKNHELEQEVGRRTEVEQLLRARNEELKAFAYTVSHDLKAPLRGIAGYAQELDRRHREGLGDRALLCITHILTATRNLDRLIEDLLYYSRLDAETSTAVVVDLRRLLDTILGDRKLAILERNVDVVIDLGPTRIFAWERGLSQVLTNLIDNALKYSRDAQPPRLRVTSEEQDGIVRITIADNGIGFNMDYHDRIFGLFNRLVRQEEFEGTGAGLAIARKLVEKMKGRLWAQSTPGAGAAFHVELAARDAATVEG